MLFFVHKLFTERRRVLQRYSCHLPRHHKIQTKSTKAVSDVWPYNARRLDDRPTSQGMVSQIHVPISSRSSHGRILDFVETDATMGRSFLELKRQRHVIQHHNGKVTGLSEFHDKKKQIAEIL